MTYTVSRGDRTEEFVVHLDNDNFSWDHTPDWRMVVFSSLSGVLEVRPTSVYHHRGTTSVGLRLNRRDAALLRQILA